MPPLQKVPPTKPAAAVKAEAEADRAKSAVAADPKDGSSEENLVVVETKLIDVPAPSSHHKLRLSDERIDAMRHVELLSTGYDRGYWGKGDRLTQLSRAQIRDRFRAAQALDHSLIEEE